MLRNLRGAYFVMCRRRVSAASKVVGATLERSSAPPKTRRATPQRAKRDECTPQFENASLGLGVAWFRRTTKEQQKFCGELRASTGHMLEPVLMINHCFTSTSQKSPLQRWYTCGSESRGPARLWRCQVVQLPPSCKLLSWSVCPSARNWTRCPRPALRVLGHTWSATAARCSSRHAQIRKTICSKRVSVALARNLRR